MKIEIEVTSPEQAEQILRILSGPTEWPPQQTTEDSVERTEKYLKEPTIKPVEEDPADAETAPEPAPAEDDSADEDPMEEAVRRATKALHDGKGKEVRRALKEVGASRVSDLKGDKITEFLTLIRDL